MSTYDDLSPYEYIDDIPSNKWHNVGWLGAGSQFKIGQVDPRVRPTLLRLAMELVNLTRGFHYCELCDEESPIQAPFDESPKGHVALGHAEIHVSGPNGITYVAPNLIIHYMDAHKYLPPQEFVDAVLRQART